MRFESYSHKLIIAEKIKTRKIIILSKAKVRFFPINFTSMAMEDTQTEAAANEKAIALPILKSVYCIRGFRKITSVPLHTYRGIPIAVITTVDQGYNEKFIVSKYWRRFINEKINPKAPATNM